jgi:hypothetical protein
MKKASGSMNLGYIIGFIVLIASVIALIFFLRSIDPEGKDELEICHNSVILRAKTLKIAGQLDCATQYICISGGKACEGMNADETISITGGVVAGGKGQTVNVPVTGAKAEILQAIADQMADCWWEFGEGKNDYMKDSFLRNTACAACSIIKFDKTIQEEFPNGISYNELLTWLNRPMNQNSEKTYLNYFYSIDKIDDLFTTKGLEVIKEDYESSTISLKERYMVRTGMVKQLDLPFGLMDADRNILPYFFESDDIPDPQCDEFITKA